MVPGRLEPSDKSEMITQLLFGEHFTVIRQLDQWLYIRTAYDHYECWIDCKQMQEISPETFSELESKEITTCMELFYVLEDQEHGHYIPITIGCSLPYFDGLTCNLEGFEYHFDGQTNSVKHGKLPQFVSEIASLYLNAPYLWGGRSPLGIDCSGFTQVVFKAAGVRLPRDAYQQAEVGQTLGKIIHVGIVLKDRFIIHASGKVRIDKLDHQGIFNRETGKYSHTLRVIKRIV